MTDHNSSSKEISMTKVTDLIERLERVNYDPALCREAAAELLRLSSECEALRHWAFNHVDVLLLYAAGSYPNDSHVKEAVEFCRIIAPGRKLRMDPLEGSGFHPASTTLQETNGGGDVG